MTRVIAYCMEWHLTRSDAFRDLLVDPLENRLHVELRNVERATTWDAAEARATPHVFCQVEPPRELLADPAARLVWIPMWDSVHGGDAAFWSSFPPTLRVVAFSEAVAGRARAAGLTTLRVRYHPNPAAFGPTRWHDGRVLLYWNRRGLAGPRFLERLCRAIGASRLLYRDDLDDSTRSDLRLDLPRVVGGAEVVRIAPRSRREYLEAVGDANVVIAPRAAEGVGMIFLEAMARGCAVLGHDAPTMNEYIVHKRNGYLFGRTDRPGRARELVERVRARRRTTATLSSRRDWSDVAAVDLERLGAQARDDQQAGYAAWLESLPRYARFLTGWAG